jgi:hypothetical protein
MIRRILLAEVTPELLASLDEPVRFVDADDNIVGYFEPQPRPPYDASDLFPQLSEEERQRRIQAGGRPLAEFLAEVGLS